MPIVPAAILFDLGFAGRRAWAGEPPTDGSAARRWLAAGGDSRSAMPGPGSAPRPAGSRAGSAAPRCVLADGAMVGALVAVNSWGAVVRPDCGRLWAAEQALAGEIPPQPAIPDAPLDPEDLSGMRPAVAGANTTIAVVATDAPLDKNACRRLRDHGAGRAGTSDPAGPYAVRRRHGVRVVDRRRRSKSIRSGWRGSAAPRPNCLARAIMRAVIAAEPLGAYPNWRQLWGGGSGG